MVPRVLHGQDTTRTIEKKPQNSIVFHNSFPGHLRYPDVAYCAKLKIAAFCLSNNRCICYFGD